MKKFMIPDSSISEKNSICYLKIFLNPVKGTRYSKISGTDFTVIPRAKPSHRQFNSRPKSSYAIF